MITVTSRQMLHCGSKVSYLRGIQRLLLHINCVDEHVGERHPGVSSDPSPQSLSPSQAWSIPIHLVLLHVNWSEEQFFGGQLISSEWSLQSLVPSHRQRSLIQRPLLQVKPGQGVIGIVVNDGASVPVIFLQPNTTYREQENKVKLLGWTLTKRAWKDLSNLNKKRSLLKSKTWKQKNIWVTFKHNTR